MSAPGDQEIRVRFAARADANLVIAEFGGAGWAGLGSDQEEKVSQRGGGDVKLLITEAGGVARR
ncbi:hypothetical protein TPA0907_12490 [Micromonospora humidisoli]|nr:hypothetical protein TPA0907_12490 [Micromonospora sp. AKA109]